VTCSAANAETRVNLPLALLRRPGNTRAPLPCCVAPSTVTQVSVTEAGQR